MTLAAGVLGAGAAPAPPPTPALRVSGRVRRATFTNRRSRSHWSGNAQRPAPPTREPETVTDLERLDRAEAKRQRKAARRNRA